jgi:opacity protein-like surface antigen
MRVLLIAMLAAGPGLADPVFETVPVPEHIYSGGWEHFVGGGVAQFDCNGDHLPELFVAGGAEKSAFFQNYSSRP